MLSSGPLACLLTALREGAPSSPGLADAAAGLAANGIAATFHAASRTDDTVTTADYLVEGGQHRIDMIPGGGAARIDHDLRLENFEIVEARSLLV